MITKSVSGEVLLEACRLLKYMRVSSDRGLVYGEGEVGKSCYIVLEGQVELFHLGRPLLSDGMGSARAQPLPHTDAPSSRASTPAGAVAMAAGGDLSLLSMQAWEERVKAGVKECVVRSGDCFGLEALGATNHSRCRRHTAVVVNTDARHAGGTNGGSASTDADGGNKAGRGSSGAHPTPSNDTATGTGPAVASPRKTGVCHLVRLDSVELARLVDRVGTDFHAKVELLRSMRTFSRWPPSAMFRFALGLGLRRVPRHTFLFRRGDPASEVYIVASGSLLETMAVTYRPEYSPALTAAKSSAAFRRSRLNATSSRGLKPTSGAMGKQDQHRTLQRRRFDAAKGLDAESVPVARLAVSRVGGGVGDNKHRARVQRIEVSILQPYDVAGGRPLLDNTSSHSTDVRAGVKCDACTLCELGCGAIAEGCVCVCGQTLIASFSQSEDNI